MPRVLFEVKVPVRIKKKAKVYISSCPVLDIQSQGYTEREAKKNLVEAIKMFIEICFENGTLDTVLKQCGFQIQKKTVKIPKDHKFVTVPIPFNVKGHCTPQCHA
jgi:predicted RNase H-like HicB family nuclease